MLIFLEIMFQMEMRQFIKNKVDLSKFSLKKCIPFSTDAGLCFDYYMKTFIDHNLQNRILCLLSLCLPHHVHVLCPTIPLLQEPSHRALCLA